MLEHGRMEDRKCLAWTGSPCSENQNPKQEVMEKRGIQLQMLPQELLHVDMDARVDIRDGQMKGINEKALVFTVFRYGFPDTSFC